MPLEREKKEDYEKEAKEVEKEILRALDREELSLKAASFIFDLLGEKLQLPGRATSWRINTEICPHCHHSNEVERPYEDMEWMQKEDCEECRKPYDVGFQIWVKATTSATDK